MKISIIKYSILFFIVFSSLMIFAQTNSNIIYGKLVDEDGKVLANANIIDKASNQGTISNHLGAFSLSLKKIPSRIEIRYLGYENRLLLVTQELINEGACVTIVLNRKTSVLETIEIEAKAEKKIYQGSYSNAIIDYTVNESGLFILFLKKRDRILRVKKWNEEVSVDHKLSFKAKSMFEDCQGNLHLVKKDSICQLGFPSQDSIYYYPFYSLEKFKKTLFLCQGFINNNFIFKTLVGHNQKVNYWVRVKGKRRVIYSVFDEIRYLFAQDMVERLGYASTNKMGDISSKDVLHDIKQAQELKWYFNVIGNIPAYNPLFARNDTIYIFNHVDGKIVCLDKNYKMIFETSIDYHNEKNWGKMIYQDKANNTFYLKFIKNGIITLKEIDIHTGTIFNEIKLYNQSFPEKITIYNNHIYYIYNNTFKKEKYLMDREIK